MKPDHQGSHGLPGSTMSIDFTANGNARRYRLFVSVPHAPPPPAGYPVLVVLDGNVCAPLFAAAVTCLGLGDEIYPPLVVGIGYPEQELGVWATRRRLDFTPGTPELDLLAPGPTPAFGGLESFLDAIVFDVAKIVREHWAVDASRSALFGHSHGGLAVLHALFTRPAMFRNWIAVSPTIWFARRAMRAKEAAFARCVEHHEVAPRLHLSVGSLEGETPAQLAPDLPFCREEIDHQIKAACMIGNARKMAHRLNALKGAPGYKIRYALLRGETHSSTPFAMVCDALRMAFAQGQWH